MKKNIFFLLSFVIGASLCLPSFIMAAASQERAQDKISSDKVSLVEPYRIVLYKQGARFMVKSDAAVSVRHGQKNVILPLPHGAKDIWVTVEHKSGTQQSEQAGLARQGALLPILAQRIEVAPPFPVAENQSSASRHRQSLQAQYDMLSNSITGLEIQERLWLRPTHAENSAEAENTLAYAKKIREISTIVTKLAEQKVQMQRKLVAIEAQLKALPEVATVSQRAVLSLDAKDTTLTEGTMLSVHYSYTLEDASWKPVYAINAKSQNSGIAVELMAEITQNSGMDWKAADIVLSTANTIERAPAPMRPWIVRNVKSPMPRGNAEAAPTLLRSAPMLVQGMANDAMRPFFSQEGIGAWTLPKEYIVPECQSTVLLKQEQWNTPLVRIARPSQYDDSVWLCAEHKLGTQFLPVGEATFFLDGVNVGKGLFAPQNGKVTLFFGVDPLVTVNTEADIRQSDAEGLVNKEQVWVWGWKYTVHNQRNTAMTVRIEEPTTQLENAAMKVSYDDIPEAEKGENNTLIWNVDVPAEGSATVQRKVTVHAPEDMHVYPGR